MIAKILLSPLSVMKDLRLNRKIQVTFFGIILPLFTVFLVFSANIYHANKNYDRVITNATLASQFSITFKEDFDYTVYLLVAYGESEALVEQIDNEIMMGRAIVGELISNTSIDDNRWRAERIEKMLNNLEDYVNRIRENKRIGGYYDENYSIWENDIQIVTSLIQSTMLEYTYYETRDINEVRLQIQNDLSRMIHVSLWIFFLLTVAALILSVVIPNSIIKPIYHLNEVTNQVAKGDLSVRAKALSGEEVQRLGCSLNGMIDKINDLVEAVKYDERNLRKAELKLLQAQINPHFLYNTLDTIVWLAEGEDRNAVVSMVTSLSEFFRTSLGEGNDTVSVSDELKHVKSYLTIQQVRYQDILTYDIQVPLVMHDLKIPKITMQPIVENALYHGIKNRRGLGEIVITGKVLEKEAVLVIRDNGIGMEESTLHYLQNQSMSNKAQEGQQGGFGIYNVNQRIRLMYGEAYGVEIESVYQEGTTVRIRIPIGTENH